MANYSTLKHSKTLGKQQILNFSTLAGTLSPKRSKTPDLCRALHRGRFGQRSILYCEV